MATAAWWRRRQASGPAAIAQTADPPGDSGTGPLHNGNRVRSSPDTVSSERQVEGGRGVKY